MIMFAIVGIIYLVSVILAWVTVNGWAFVLSVVSGALTVFWVVRDAD